MREAVRAMHDSVIAQGRGGTHQAREERDVIVRTSKARLEQLSIGDESLCFGRIDREEGEVFHIGRIAVWDERQEPLVVDWRAPVAEPFYRATGRHPMGLTRRRHFTTDGPRIVAIEDEVFDLDLLDAASDLVGEGALFAALERERSGAMRDIVATIQGEQDEIIRAPMQEVLVVQGAPGTGKTAVALHRAAYLLYTHRFPLERQGVLVLGPNPVFMRYIEHVLPSLGETGVDLSTVNGLYQGDGARPSVTEDGHAARIKGDARMAKVVAKAVRDRQRPLPSDITVPFGQFSLTFTVADSAAAIASARRRRGPHNTRRRYVERFVFERLHEHYLDAFQRSRRVGLRAGEGGDEADLQSLTQEVRGLPEVRAALERMWPRLTPEELLRDVFGARPLLRLAANGTLTPGEQERLVRPRPPAGNESQWTDADIPLLDEAAVLLGPRRKKKKGDEDDLRTYGHIVVDEAQDLTPMQLRMVARRSMSGSLTVVGDIAQATGHTPPSDWSDVLAHLPRRKRSRVVELSVNYRTPAEVMQVAAKVLAVAAPHLKPPRSVRSGDAPEFAEVERGELIAEAAAHARRLQDVVGGTAAVICPPSLAPPLAAALGVDGEISLDAPISVVPIGTAKGLEFDAVVVVEPALLVDESPQGLRGLYVAMTRTTKRLTIVHSRPLPTNLRQ